MDDASIERAAQVPPDHGDVLARPTCLVSAPGSGTMSRQVLRMRIRA
jgi:hypothetical protein